jgi:hypothetical protein
MATYVNDLRLKEITTGDESGTWGTSTNTNLELIAEAFSYGTEVITTNADTHTTTIADGATDPGRALYLKYTGTLDSACTITIGPNTVSKVWIVENGTSGSQNIILSQGSGANITIPAGDTKVVYSDGAGAGAAFVDAFASLSVVDLKVQDDLTVTDDLIVNGDIDLEGNMDVNGSLETDALSLNGTTVTSTAAEINLLDGSSANTVVNSKAVIYGSSGEVAGTLSTAAQPNITSVGTLTGFTSTGIDDNATSTAITIDSSENVGIGTTSPNKLLHLKANTPVINLHSDNASSAQISFTNSGGVSEQGFIKYEHDGDFSGNMQFRVAGSERVRIDASGNVGIGRTPTAVESAYDSIQLGAGGMYLAGSANLAAGQLGQNFYVDASGNIKYLGDDEAERITFNNGIITFDNAPTNASGAGAALTFNERMRIDSSGNVGIGSTSPDELLTLRNADPTLLIQGNQVSGVHYSEIDFKNQAGSVLGKIGLSYYGGASEFYRNVPTGWSHVWKVNNSEKMRLDSSGNVGIGETNPEAKLHVKNASAGTFTASNSNLLVENNTTVRISMVSPNTNGCAIEFGDTDDQNVGQINYDHSSNYMRFDTAGSERMRIDSSGNALFGCTALPSGGAGGAAFETGQSSGRSILQLGTTSTFALRLANFYNGNGNVGNIIVSGSATAFNTSSDARLKDVTGKARGLEVINQLNPVSYNWKVDGKADEGLIAQEVLDIVPNAVSGSEEEKYYMDYSKLVVHLVAGMKEQQALIESLTARITTLEG